MRSTAQECAHKRSISLSHDSKTTRQPHAACDFPKASAQIPTPLCHTLFPRIRSQWQRVKGAFKHSKLIIFSSTLFMETMESTPAPLCWPAGSACQPSVSNPPRRSVVFLLELEETSRPIPWSEALAVTWDLLTCEFLLPSPLPCTAAGTARGSPCPSGAAEGC